ncbi:solute carrier family 25 member 35-like [Diadema antillarum]|uniref:solute carrier family 25 member 35-like n=1 Tax=Diadema antillarum TaxID=105358 RepID=UPI003A8845D4
MPVDVVEFVLGGLAASCAVVFTNPLEVVKTRFQLQGELRALGTYHRHYRNVFHAFYIIGRFDGLVALQSGLGPAIVYQMMQNGTRLGTYQLMQDFLTKNSTSSRARIVPTILAAGIAGSLGAFVSSPMYLIKTQMQSQSVEVIAVGHQHEHTNWMRGLRRVYVEGGIPGLWRGVSAQTARNGIGSMVQLPAFTASKQWVADTQVFSPNSYFVPIIASMIAGAGNVVVMTPLDVISTRLYNQGLDNRGKGLYYRGFWDCVVKILRQEGPLGFYKGWSASWFRLAPQTVLSLSFWDVARKHYHRHLERREKLMTDGVP